MTTKNSIFLIIGLQALSLLTSSLSKLVTFDAGYFGFLALTAFLFSIAFASQLLIKYF